MHSKKYFRINAWRDGAAIVIFAMLFLFPSSSIALTQEQMDQCAGKNNPTAELRISGCTAALESGLFNGNTLAVIFRFRSAGYGAQQHYKLAVADLDKALAISPNDIDLLNARCWDRALDNQQGAQEDCDAALAIQPDYAPALDSRGLIGLKQHRFQDAWNDYNAAALKDPRPGTSWLYGRGVAALRLGREAEGRADIAKATAAWARLPELYSSYGIVP